MTRRFTAPRRPLLALGTIAAGGLSLTACGDTPAQDAAYTSPAQCIEAGVNADICSAEYQQAMQAHLKNAPKFDGQAACEAEYGAGRCMETSAAATGTQGSGSGSFFMPFMTGYLISSAISNLSNYGAYQRQRESGGYSSVPIYTNRSGVSYRSDPVAIGQAPQQRPVNVNTRTVSRQGFGGMSSSRGMSFGG